MVIQHKVIIIDDDKLATHNWKILFHFVGEEVSSLNSIQAEKKFSEGLNQEAVLAIMIGSISNKQYSVPAFI